MNFDNKIALALSFSTENRSIVRFDFWGVKNVLEEENNPDSVYTEKCEDNEAQAWGVYTIVQDGDLQLPVWIADLDDKEGGKRFRDILSNIFRPVENAGPVNDTFISSSFDEDIATLSSKKAQYYIEPSSSAPAWFTLIVLGEFLPGDKEVCYSYSSKENIAHDIALARKKHDVEITEISLSAEGEVSAAFYHIEFASDCIGVFSNHTQYPYTISQISPSPESWMLRIETGDGETQEYIYDCKQKARADLAIAYWLYKYDFILTESEG